MSLVDAANVLATLAERQFMPETAQLMRRPSHTVMETVRCRRDGQPPRRQDELPSDVRADMRIVVPRSVVVNERDRFVVGGITYQVQTVSADDSYPVERLCDCVEVR